jgi:hypothetical protein
VLCCVLIACHSLVSKPESGKSVGVGYPGRILGWGPNPREPPLGADDGGMGESTRSTTSVKLRLSPEISLLLHMSARVRGLTLSEYVSGLVLQASSAPDSSRPMEEISLADVSRLAFAAGALPAELKRLHGELLRQGGLAKHLYLEGADPEATARALLSIQEMAQQITEVLKHVLASHAELRTDLERAARLLAGR